MDFDAEEHARIVEDLLGASRQVMEGGTPNTMLMPPRQFRRLLILERARSGALAILCRLRLENRVLDIEEARARRLAG